MTINSKKHHKAKQMTPWWDETGRLSFRRIYLFLIVLCLIFYGNTILNDYSLDDVYVTNNEQVKKGFAALGEIFTTQYARDIYESGEPLSFGYRPVVKATFAIEYGLFGLNPHISHLINLLMYIMTVLLVFIIFQKLFSNIQVNRLIFPFVATVIFLIHPIHTEVVSSLKNRDELMSFLFGLCSLMLFYRFVSGRGWYYLPLGFLSYVVAYLSKSSAIAFLAAIPFLLWFLPDVKKNRIVWVTIILVVAYFGIKLGIAQMFPDRFRPKQFVENPMLDYNRLKRIPTGLFILLFYLKMIFIPYPMRFYYGYNMFPVKDWGDPIVWLSLVIHFSLLIFAIYSFKKNKAFFLGIIIYLIFISMYTNIVRLIMGIAADRFLYAPSLGFSLVLTAIIFSLLKIDLNEEPKDFRKIKSLQKIMLVLIIVSAILTISRNHQWRTQESLVRHDIRYLKNSARANYIYAGMLKNEAMKDAMNTDGFHSWDKVELALEHYRQALGVFPDYYQAYNMMGQIYFDFYKEKQKAIEYFEKAVQLNPSYVPALSNLAWAYYKMKDYNKAEKYYLDLLKLKPGNKTFQEELNRLYSEAGVK